MTDCTHLPPKVYVCSTCLSEEIQQLNYRLLEWSDVYAMAEMEIDRLRGKLRECEVNGG